MFLSQPLKAMCGDVDGSGSMMSRDFSIRSPHKLPSSSGSSAYAKTS